MVSISTLIFYILAFCSMYVQIFFLITFLERRKTLAAPKKKHVLLEEYPSVTVVVPCWNEERTVGRTVESLLALEYPQDKLRVFLVDDGSTDSTWSVIQDLARHPQVEAFHKENGGKHTALNLGISKAESRFIACLDADSFVEPDALQRLMKYFEDKETMAVAPAALIDSPKTLVQVAQFIEYHMAVFNKKMLGIVGGLHVTPGTLPVYRREVFDIVGGFRKAYNTEDGEFALRMQEYHLKIDYCADAIVRTVGPDTVRKLYKQRLRWTYGFMRNLMDYRHLIFKKEFGNLGFFTLPAGVLSIASAVYLFVIFGINAVQFLAKQISYYRTVGWSFSLPAVSFDWFFISTKMVVFVMVILYALLILSMVLGRRLVEGRFRFSVHIISFMVLYSLIAPFWLLKAIYNVIFRQQTSWR